MKKLKNEVNPNGLSYERILIKDSLAVMQLMRDQIDQMGGLFDDEDGTIATAIDEHDTMALRIERYLDSITGEENMIDNRTRINRARHTLLWYKKRALKEGGSVFQEDIVDLITDIKHYCHQQGVDFHEILSMANTNFVAEFNEEARKI